MKTFYLFLFLGSIFGHKLVIKEAEDLDQLLDKYDNQDTAQPDQSQDNNDDTLLQEQEMTEDGQEIDYK